MSLRQSDMMSRAREAKNAADQQMRAFHDAVANGLPARATHHAEQASQLAREAKQLLSRANKLYW